MVAQNVFHRASSDQTINLWLFADRWVSVFKNFIIHQIFYEILQPLQDFRIQRVSPVLSTTGLSVLSWVPFYGVFGFCLTWSTIWSSRSRVLVSLTVGDEDELEEDVEQWLSRLESVLEVDGSDPEDELADKPGTTIGTKFSVLHCIRIPSLMRCGFWPLIHS